VIKSEEEKRISRDWRKIVDRGGLKRRGHKGSCSKKEVDDHDSSKRGRRIVHDREQPLRQKKGCG